MYGWPLMGNYERLLGSVRDMTAMDADNAVAVARAAEVAAFLPTPQRDAVTELVARFDLVTHLWNEAVAETVRLARVAETRAADADRLRDAVAHLIGRGHK